MQNLNKNSFYFYVNTTLLSFIIVWILIAGITSLLTVKLSSDLINTWIKDSDSTNMFLSILKSGNQYFVKNEDIEEISLSEITLKLATSVKPEDPRTFLGRELPGFSLFDTKIQIAGKGTDYTTLPIESPPPMEELLKEREIIQSELDQYLKEDNTSNYPLGHKTIERKNVYIYHTHSWESFLPLLKNAKEPKDAISNNNNVNVVSIGSKLTKILESKGIGTEHETTNVTQELHKKGWSSSNSYKFSRSLVTEAMGYNKELEYLIDIHRDSLRKDKTTIKINGKYYARILFVVGESNKNFGKNLKLAEDFHYALEKKYPGLSKGVTSKDKTKGNGVYNQDLSDRAMLIEFGGVDNNSEEINNTINAFAEVFSEYYWNTKNAESY